MNIGFDFIFPEETGFTGAVLDNYLAAGYYRTQHLLFTTHETPMSSVDKTYPVFWLRIPIKNIVESASATAIRKRCSSFSFSYRKAVVTKKVNDLYSLYLNNIDFEAAVSCESYLFHPYFENPFQSKMLEIKDGKNLIALGYFDVGKISIAGILNFYHPAYKKYSLGKFLMLKKIDYAIAQELQYYYTGYISTESNKFDYKVFPDKKAVEVFLPVEKIWVPYHLMGKEKLAEYFDKYIK